MIDLTNKIVVITGGGSGIGKAMAKKFNAQGAKIVLFDKNEQQLQTTLQELNHSIAISGDVKKLADLERLFQEIEKQLGKIDVLIANAGIGDRRLIDHVDEAFFDEIIDVDFKGVFFTVQRAVPLLNQGASVILIASVASHLTWAAHSVYSSAKAAVSMLIRNFAADLIGRGIRVNGISPGFTDTPIFDPMKKSNPKFITQLEKNVPAGRFAQADEIADAALFLTNNTYLVGVDLIIDGGMSAMREWV